jgi:DNA-directed RNA polymerase specialized sigma24 family protein
MACPSEHIGDAGPSAPRQYATNVDLLTEIRRSKRLRRITPELARMLLAIAEGYSHRSNWRGYSYREDLVGAAMPRLCLAVFAFKLTRKNPFAYFTTTVHNAFLQALKKEHKHARIASIARALHDDVQAGA